jgi:hypothetical protein
MPDKRDRAGKEKDVKLIFSMTLFLENMGFSLSRGLVLK